MPRPTDIYPVASELYFLPVLTRMPLKFGPEVLTSVTCARVRLRVANRAGQTAEGWGETPLSVQWVWPSALSYEERHQELKKFCLRLNDFWAAGLSAKEAGHPLELGHHVLEEHLGPLTRQFNEKERPLAEPIPYLAALVCDSAFDIALHDAFGKLHGTPTYQTYSSEWMSKDLAGFLEALPGYESVFQGALPSDFLRMPRREILPAWHLVGGKDPLDASDLTGNEPEDGEPVLLRDWIRRDGLECLKVKLAGNDAAWDRDRLLRVGSIAIETGVRWLSADFNCTVHEPAYVNEILDWLRDSHPQIFAMILYVEQPFPYDLEAHGIDVHSTSARKPLFLDESAHDWRLVRLGRSLGWSGVALKTCKTQTGALLSLCWAKAHGMPLMVQDLTNPMLAQIPHVLLAAHAGTIMGVETNSMQFYPAASAPEAAVHPGIYSRRRGQVDLHSIHGTGFGYRLDEIQRVLPAPAASAGF